MLSASAVPYRSPRAAGDTLDRLVELDARDATAALAAGEPVPGQDVAVMWAT